MGRKDSRLQTDVLVLIADSELLRLMGDHVTLPPDVQAEERDDLGLTVLHVAFPAARAQRAALTGLRSHLDELRVLADPAWMTPAEAARLLHRYQPVAYRYIVTTHDDQVADYLNFGAAFAGPAVGRYRVVRVPEEHATWQHTRLATGWQPGCRDLFARYEEAVAVIGALNIRHKGGQQ
jgi:hypothetical protein